MEGRERRLEGDGRKDYLKKRDGSEAREREEDVA